MNDADIREANRLKTYEVTFDHPDLTGPFVVEVNAFSAARAEQRTRWAAMQTFRHVEFLTEGGVTVREMTDGGVR